MEYAIEKSKHSKTNADIWVVKLKEKVEYDKFKEINVEMKKKGGYYSRFVSGFIFKEDPTVKLEGKSTESTPKAEKFNYSFEYEPGFTIDQIGVLVKTKGFPVFKYSEDLEEIKFKTKSALTKATPIIEELLFDPKKDNSRNDFIDDLDPLDMWQEFSGRWFRRFQFSLTDASKAREIIDIGIKERSTIPDVASNEPYDVIISVGNKSIADSVSQKYMELFPIKSSIEAPAMRYKVGDKVIYYQDDKPSVIKEIQDGKYLLDNGNGVMYVLASEDQVKPIEEAPLEFKFEKGNLVEFFKSPTLRGEPAKVTDRIVEEYGNSYLINFINISQEAQVSEDDLILWRGYRKSFENENVLTDIADIEEFPKYEFDSDRGEFFFGTKEDAEKAAYLVMQFNRKNEESAPTEKEVTPVISGDKLSSQDRINKEVRELLSKKGLSRHLYNHADFMLLSQYTGDTKTQEDKKDGYIWDYYTPDEAVRVCWQLAYKYGFKPTESSKILEPSCGTGRFLRYAPDYCKVKAFEIDDISYKISKLLYPNFDVVNDSFESAFYTKTGLKKFDYKPIYETYNLIIGNPPYMYPYTSIYKDKEKALYPFIQSLEQMFMTRSVDSLEPNGLLIFIIPSTIIDNTGSFDDFKKYIAEKTNMIDSYRLPSGTFKNTGITTDIVVLQKK